MGLEPASVHVCVTVSYLSKMNIAETSGPVAIKFYLNRSIIGVGKGCFGFWPDRIGTLVSMVTDCSHRVIMGKILLAI